MIPRVQKAEYVRDHVMRIWFSDGTEGELDLSGELDGEVFEPLRDMSFFRQFRVDPELHTLIWPNGADFAPEFLHERVRILA
jgi:hypothetical protein